MFDGPGQGMTLCRTGLIMRPDWEYVAGHVLDFVIETARAHPGWELDVNRIVVSGSALGGYLALCAASDPRVKACVAMDPMYDMFDFGTRHVAPLLMWAWVNEWVADAVLDQLLVFAVRFSFQLRWEVSTAGGILGARRPTELLREMKKFTLKLPDGGTFLSRMQCLTLVSGARKSVYFPVDEHTGRV